MSWRQVVVRKHLRQPHDVESTVCESRKRYLITYYSTEIIVRNYSVQALDSPEIGNSIERIIDNE